jgi:hypothetical protein
VHHLNCTNIIVFFEGIHYNRIEAITPIQLRCGWGVCAERFIHLCYERSLLILPHQQLVTFAMLLIHHCYYYYLKKKRRSILMTKCLIHSFIRSMLVIICCMFHSLTTNCCPLMTMHQTGGPSETGVPIAWRCTSDGSISLII